MSAELLELGVAEIAEAIATGDLDAAQLLDSYADWITQSSAQTGAFTGIDFDIARDSLPKALDSGGPLAGVPMAIKDLIHVRGFRTTCASKMLAEYRPPFDACVTERLRTAGSVFFGKLNMDEFAMGSSSENSAFHKVHNPWDPERAPGGSSGGSAAAVAARQTPATLGSDTGGSIRQPAALCGITGLKPTYGRVSRFGLVAFASSLDQIGPMARSARDCALLFSVIAGHDPRDATSDASSSATMTDALAPLKKGLKVGLPVEYFGEGLDDEVRQAVDTVRDWLAKHGAQVQPVELPHTRYTTATYYLIATAEASSNLGRFDGIRYGHRAADAADLDALYRKTRAEGFGPEVKRRIMLGTFALSSGYYDAYYGTAQRARTRIRGDFDNAFTQVDVILTPTTPTTAFKLGEKVDDPLQMYLNDVYTNGCNLAGIPGISFPCGVDSAGLPIGAQLMGPAGTDEQLLSMANAWQSETDWHIKKPRICPGQSK